MQLQHLILSALLLLSGIQLPAQYMRFKVLQINDIYEIGPLSGGKEGGPARVAALRKKLEQKKTPLITVLAGDFVSPSVMNSVKHEGEKLKGKQLIDVLNATGVNLVTFGNHEFDISVTELQKRIKESQFEWISANVKQKTPNGLMPFYKETENGKIPFKPCTTYVFQQGKKSVKVGFAGVTLQGFTPEYAEISSYIDAARTCYDFLTLRDSARVLIALTHLNIEEDRELAKACPGYHLQIGGHEHQNHIETVGTTTIAKADANVRSVYLHEFKVWAGNADKNKAPKLKSKLIKITDKMPDDPATLAVAAKWKAIAWADFKNQGFQPDRVIRKLDAELDGLEANIRNHQTNLGTLIAAAYQWAAGDKIQAGILNGGSIRIDDHIHSALTEYDVLRVLPFGGNVVSMEMKGSLLQQWLQDGKANKGSGGYLQFTSNITEQDGVFHLNGLAIDTDTWYSIASSDFMMTGKEKNMGYLNPENPDIRAIQHYTQPNHPGRDVRHALIGYVDQMHTPVK